MKRYEYMKIHRKFIPQDIFDKYELADKLAGDFVYVEIQKGMYGLPQSGRIANEWLKPHLEKWGCYECEHTHGLFKHETRPVMFALVVDDFGVQYIGKDNTEHLYECIKAKCTCTYEEEGDLCCGIKLEWNYDEHWVDLSMPGYVEKNLQRFTHIKPDKPQHAPHSCAEPIYGAKKQMAQVDESPEVSADKKENSTASNRSILILRESNRQHVISSIR